MLANLLARSLPLACALASSMLSFATHAAATKLADQPLTAATTGSANVMLTPSVEWPTALGVAHKDASFNPTFNYIGYFDYKKCYTYNGTYFAPVALATLVGGAYQCNSQWSGNLLNFATMQTIDIFRWTMTGGSRWVDPDDTPARNYDLPFDSKDTSTPIVVLRRAYSNNLGSDSIFPVKRLASTVAGGISKYMPAITGVSAGANVGFDSLSRGIQFAVANTNTDKHSNFPTPAAIYNAAVEVCNFAVGIEENCAKYAVKNGFVYKPEGLMQKYKDSFRFAIFGYLNRQYASGNSGPDLDGAALRAPMKNINVELTDVGAFVRNPDKVLADATASSDGAIQDSGAINYLNKFGFRSKDYKQHDPVGEMYAEAIRYFQGKTGSSPTTIPVATPTRKELDYFPMVTDWRQYPAIRFACDANYIIGIGDVNTHADKNITTTDSPKAAIEDPRGYIDVTPADARTWTQKIGALEGMTGLETRQTIGGDGTGWDFVSNSTASVGKCCNENGFYMAGLAYWANTNDVNPNIAGTQTVTTHWVDVLEKLIYKNKNQYWLAAKYGGFLGLHR